MDMNKNRHLNYSFLLFLAVLLNFSLSHAQEKTVVRGRIVDAVTGEVLPYASIGFKNLKKTVGTTTNSKGNYYLETKEYADSVVATYLGYHTEHIAIRSGETQELIVKMRERSIEMASVTITEKKGRYSKKDNPAVELMRKAIERKSENRMEGQSYYQFRQHEKMELSFTNLSDSVKNSKSFKKIDFIFDNLDSLSFTGKKYLPFYFSENISDKYFRKSPKASKTYIDAYKDIEISKFMNAETMDAPIREIFGEIDIYNNSVIFLSNQFMSPLSPLAPDFYKFYIIDTLFVHDVECYKMGFIPRNVADFGFMGHLYLTADSNYAIKRVEMELTKNSQVNYVEELLIEKEYSLIDGVWSLTKDATMVDFSLFGMNLYGRKENTYSDFLFNTPQPDELYQGAAKVIRNNGFDKRDETYWEENRISSLTEKEENTYRTFRQLNDVGIYRFVRDFTLAIVGGYFEAGALDIGPLENMLSFNSIEGARFRIGGKTNGSLSHHFFAESYLAYGTRDEKFKYNLTGHYSFNEKKNHPWEFPMNLLTVIYEYDTKIPGQGFLYGTGDRLTLSIGRGETEKMTLERRLEINYKKENVNHFTYDLNFARIEQHPLGKLSFETYNGNRYDPYTTTSFGLNLRFAPNEKYTQMQQNRYPMNPTYPVYELKYQMGINDFWGGDYTFHKIKASFQKRWFISSFGFLDLFANAGKILNQVPYPSLFVHQANQNYAFQDEAYNSMRYFEFVSDQYFDAQFAYCFNGFVFNRIPLIKHLKLREYITFKALFGSVSDNNTPSIDKHPELMIFPQNRNGEPTTFSLNDGPFMEASVGIDNIFTILRVDLVKRLNYLDNPDIDEWSVRFRLRFTF